MKRGKLIRTLDYWRKHTKASNSLRDLVLQNLDFTKEAINWESLN